MCKAAVRRVSVMVIIAMTCGCERAPERRAERTAAADSAQTQELARMVNGQRAADTANVSLVERTAKEYAALVGPAGAGNVQFDKLTPAEISNLPYALLMPLRDHLYELRKREKTALEVERIARLLLHCTNMAIHHRTELLRMLGDSLRTQGQLAEATEAYKAVIEERLQDGPGHTDGDAIGACVILQAMYGEEGNGAAQLQYARTGYELAQQHREYPRTRDAPAFVYAQALLQNGDYETARRVLTDTAWVKEESRQMAAQMIADIPAFAQRQQEQARLRQETEARLRQLPADVRAQVERELQNIKQDDNSQ